MADEFVDGLTYARTEPDIESLTEAYRRDLDNAQGFFDKCADNRNQVVQWWPGQSRDQKKSGLNAKPWPGASDMQVPVIEPRIDSLVALCMTAIRDGHVAAWPVGSNSPEAAAQTSTFMRWMMDSWIPNFYDEIELSLHHMFEKGMATTFAGWENRRRKHLERFDLQQFAQVDPALAELFLDPANDEQVMQMLQANFDEVDEKGAKRALRMLRKVGFADIPVIKSDIERPLVVAKDPSADFVMPSYTIDVARATRVHLRSFMTAQDLLNAIDSQGWNKAWVEDVIENHMGVSQSEMDGEYSDRSGYNVNNQATIFDIGSKDARDLVEVVRTFERKVDPEYHAEGIYETVWCYKQNTGGLRSNESWGKYELLNGYDEFPIAVTPITRDTKRIYDVRSIADRLRGNQRMAKVTRDSTLDQFSIRNNPPRTHPAGRPASIWGAGADFPTRRGEENLYRILDVPDNTRSGVDLEEYLDMEADWMCGLKEDSPLALKKQQYFIDRALYHVGQVARLSYKAYQKLYSKDEIYFRVTGSPDPQVYNRDPNQEDIEIKLYWDTRLNDPEFVDKTTSTLLQLKQLNTDGNYSNKEIDAVIAHLTVPQFSNRILRSQDQAQAEIVENVAKDLALIWSGQSVGARPEGANIALQYIEQYSQKPNVAQRLAEDPQFAQDLGTYVEQYEFQVQQAQNAQIGRIGTNPADLQGVQVQ